MNQGNERRHPDRIKKAILHTLFDAFAEPDFDNEGGVVRLLDHDDACLQLGFFSTDDDGEIRTDVPEEVWTIEVTHEREGETK